MNDITADLARALFRAERAERERDRLIAHIARLEGVDIQTARIRHLPNEGKP